MDRKKDPEPVSSTDAPGTGDNSGAAVEPKPPAAPAASVDTPMTLRQRQSLFARKMAELILEAHKMGIEVTLGEAWRPEVTAQYYEKTGIGKANSLHCDRLAVDLNVFVFGEYQTDNEAYRPLGEWWDRQGDDFHWGGSFGDGNHFSMGDGRSNRK